MINFTEAQCYILIKDILTLILTSLGLIIAGMGLATWKKQIKGSKEFDIAYNLRYAVLRLRDAIKYVRHPAIWPSESENALEYSKNKHPNRSAEDIEKNNHSYVYEMRWEKIVEASTEMESHLLAAEVLWGSEILEKIKPFRAKITELNIALRQYFQPELRTKDTMTLHNIIYYKGDNDEFSKEIDEAVKVVVDYIKIKTS